MLKFVSSLSLSGSKILEPGAGTGVISILASYMGGTVTSTDINPLAIQNIQRNAEINQAKLTVIHSDLFEQIPRDLFDLIIVNPPYYPKEPQRAEDYAFYCGAHFEYFERFFSEGRDFLAVGGKIYMIFSEDCDLKKILEIAQQNGWQYELVSHSKVWGEWNGIFEFQKRN